MPTVTVLAPDSALAMDEVIRQLGENAYIVATNARDGQVRFSLQTNLRNNRYNANAPPRSALLMRYRNVWGKPQR